MKDTGNRKLAGEKHTPGRAAAVKNSGNQKLAGEKHTLGWVVGMKELTRKQQIGLVVRLSIPAILAEVSSIIMQYIDAAMVGSLGADASAAIGLVTSSSWLLGGLCVSAVTGFSVQAAQFVGAGRDDKAQDVFCQSIVMALVFGGLLSAAGIFASPRLPVWLGAKADISPMASRYFFIFSCALPATQLRQLAGGMLQCSGDMKTPGILNTVMCMLDVVFNAALIFPAREVSVFGKSLTLAGAGLGVAGAALGTALSEILIAVLMLAAACRRFLPRQDWRKAVWKPSAAYYPKSFIIYTQQINVSLICHQRPF